MQEDGTWRTVGGRRIFIKDGQSLNSAMKESGKFKNDNLLGKEFKGLKGQEAIDKLLEEKQGHIKGAFTREDIGDIDLIWGDDNKGVQHIINRRTEQGINPTDFLKKLPDIVEKGDLKVSNRQGKELRFEIFYKNSKAIISTEINKEKLNFVLTAFET